MPPSSEFTFLQCHRLPSFPSDSLDILEDTDSITFNASDIDLTDATIVDSVSGQSHAQVSRTDDTKQERVQLKFPTSFKKGTKTQLSLGWSATLTGSMVGEYIGSHSGALSCQRQTRDCPFVVGYYKSAFEKDGKKK